MKKAKNYLFERFEKTKKKKHLHSRSIDFYMSPSSEDDEARRLALAALSVGDAAEALRLSRYPTSGSGRAKPWVSGCCRFQLLFRSLPLCDQPPGHLTVSLCPHPPTPSPTPPSPFLLLPMSPLKPPPVTRACSVCGAQQFSPPQRQRELQGPCCTLTGDV